MSTCIRAVHVHSFLPKRNETGRSLVRQVECRELRTRVKGIHVVTLHGGGAWGRLVQQRDWRESLLGVTRPVDDSRQTLLQTSRQLSARCIAWPHLLFANVSVGYLPPVHVVHEDAVVMVTQA